MTKFSILGIINVILAISSTVILAVIGSSSSHRSPTTLSTSLQTYILELVLIFSIVFNALLAYQLLVKKRKDTSIRPYIILTFSTVFWILLLFLSYFFAAQAVYLLICLAVVISLFYSLYPFSKKIALTIAAITLLATTTTIALNFEESYCWGKGEKAETYNGQMVMATSEDVKMLEEYSITENSQIGAHFKTHMRCHKTFNLLVAIKESYFLSH